MDGQLDPFEIGEYAGRKKEVGFPCVGARCEELSVQAESALLLRGACDIDRCLPLSDERRAPPILPSRYVADDDHVPKVAWSKGSVKRNDGLELQEYRS